MISTGDKLGRYKIRSAIGKGGMGEVFLAEDTELERLIALKILPQDLANDTERMRRFVQEAKSASALNHPNIITIHEIGKTDKTHFIATEYIEGETLHSRLKSERMNFKSVLDVAIQVISALDAAHRAGIVHRDIKPENVMIRPDGVVKILDFGIAKLTEKKVATIDAEAATTIKAEGTTPGTIIGTASYMSPEQAKGKPVDARSDIFSFGVVLYESLSGKQPFEGENAMDVIGSILNKEPVPIQQLIPEVPQEIGRIISKTLKKDREERYQTAKDLLIDLKDVKQDLEFQNKLERTSSPNRENVKTQVFNAATGNAAHTTSSAEYIATEIKQHKRGFVVGLAILLLAAIGLGYWFFANRSAAQIESIAVMPFVNESGNVDVEYLSDGMTETLINSLSQLPKLSVKARSSVFHYKGKTVTTQTVASELTVQAILNGRVVQRGDNLLLSLELVDARTGNQIWGEQYNRKLTDIAALQSEIVRDVSQKLRTRLSGADEQKLSKNFTVNPEAYQLYLKGRYHWNKRTGADIRKSVDYFQQAVDKDPNYALAYAGLAQAYILIPNYARESPKEPYEKARAAAMKALEMDETLADAHTALASIKADYDWNFPEAEKEFRRAIELNPNDATTRQWHSGNLLVLGRNDEAIAEMKKNRQYDQAIEQLQKTVEMDRNFPRAHLYLELTYEEKEMFEEAISEFEKHSVLQAISPEEAAKEATELREGYKKSGANGYWRKQIEIAEKRRASHSESSLPLSVEASFYAQLRENDRAFALLEKAYEQREAELIYLKSPIYDSLRSDPRFQDLLRRVGFTP
ncbi:MAG: protein kinase [Acidobacteria bacterium]|nr:protein kinase [Acidobacteriota bacterium]